MEAFFKKYPMHFSEITAIKMIHHKIECAKKALKKDKKGMEHRKYLAEAYRMLCDYFDELGINPDEM